MKCIKCNDNEAVIGNYCLECQPEDDPEELHRWDSNLEKPAGGEPEAEKEPGGETEEG